MSVSSIRGFSLRTEWIIPENEWFFMVRAMQTAEKLLKTVCDRITAAQVANQCADKVKLLAVSKTFSAEKVMDFYQLGQRDFGENYIQEWISKKKQLPSDIVWHVIGHVQRNKSKWVAMVFRAIPTTPVSLEELDAPDIFKDLVAQPRGLILVTGPTGSGKSTTLAAMIDHLNKHTRQHILTIEDPIEFVHQSKKCLINQRELNQNTLSFHNALKAAMREDPDIILVGEMRDIETIRLALTAAETGHLVLATLHTTGAAKSIDRIVDVFPGSEKDMIRTMLSESLIAVISQTLIKTADGKNRVAAHEIMTATPAIKNLIRENKIAQMNSSIQTGAAFGMQTLDQALNNLVRQGIITEAAAKDKSSSPGNISKNPT